MKIKSLLAAVAILLTAAFAVACGEAADTTAADTSGDATSAVTTTAEATSSATATVTNATVISTTATVMSTTVTATATKTTTTAITTATTTKVTTTMATATKVTTTKLTTARTTATRFPTMTYDPLGNSCYIPNQLESVIPPTVPGAGSYSFISRIGFEAESDFSRLGLILCDNVRFSAEGAAFGNAWRMEIKEERLAMGGNAAHAEASFGLKDTVDLYGAVGVLFYIDFGYVDGVEGKLCVSIPLLGDGLYLRSHIGGYDAKRAVSYYYENGKWNQTYNVYGCRMLLPNYFAGWVYIPLSSYINTQSSQKGIPLCDPTTGRVEEHYLISQVSIFTDGYAYETGKPIILDEVLIIK